MNKITTLLLHIGTEKTGTTSIQEFLAHNRPRLKELGILYPLCFGTKNHSKLAAYAEPSFGKRILGLDTEAKHSQFCLDLELQFQNEINSHTYHSAIISNEHLHSNISNLAAMQSLKKFLERHFSAIKVLVYFRRQDLMATSRYTTAVLAGHVPSQQLNIAETRWHYYNFNAIYQQWANVFGTENIEARPFLRENMVDGNVVADFCTRAGLTPDDGLVMTERKNESLSLEALCLLLELNERIRDGKLVFSQPLRKKNQLVASISSQFKGKPYYPSRPTAIKFYQACLANNNALEQHLKTQLFNDDFSMYPEQDNGTLFQEKRLWATTALDEFDLTSPVQALATQAA